MKFKLLNASFFEVTPVLVLVMWHTYLASGIVTLTFLENLSAQKYLVLYYLKNCANGNLIYLISNMN